MAKRINLYNHFDIIKNFISSINYNRYIFTFRINQLGGNTCKLSNHLNQI